MMQKKKVLLTGANGFVGSFLAADLLQKGYEVYCFVRSTSNLQWIADLDLNFIYGNLFDKKSIKFLTALLFVNSQ